MKSNFTPPFCPAPDCPEHTENPNKHRNWWILRGFYFSRTHGHVQRYLCKTCGKSFTERIFHLDYYAKRIDIDLKDLLFHYCNGFSQRALAEHFGCTTRTIAHKLQILSRQSMAAITESNRCIHTLEDIAIDGMQNFTGSQYQPNNYTIAVGQYSQYVGMVTQVIFRRAGKMNTYQKRRRAYFDTIGLWKRGAFTNSIRELVDHIVQVVENRSQDKQSIVCNSDDKKLYAQQLWKNEKIARMMASSRFVHSITSSRCWRDMKNPLFPVNYIDSRLRNDLADWQRETTSFPREANRNFQRFLCYLAYHNFFKPYRVRKPDKNHAEAAGLPHTDSERIKRAFFNRRAFHSQTALSPQWDDCWFCRIVTPLQVRDKIPFNGNRKPAYLHF